MSAPPREQGDARVATPLAPEAEALLARLEAEPWAFHIYTALRAARPGLVTAVFAWQ